MTEYKGKENKVRFEAQLWYYKWKTLFTSLSKQTWCYWKGCYFWGPLAANISKRIFLLGMWGPHWPWNTSILHFPLISSPPNFNGCFCRMWCYVADRFIHSIIEFICDDSVEGNSSFGDKTMGTGESCPLWGVKTANFSRSSPFWAVLSMMAAHSEVLCGSEIKRMGGWEVQSC